MKLAQRAFAVPAAVAVVVTGAVAVPAASVGPTAVRAALAVRAAIVVPVAVAGRAGIVVPVAVALLAVRAVAVRAAVVVPVAVALLARVLTGPHAIDDAYITFRYARNLAEGLGLVYNPGEWVLGTTAPLWAVVLAGGYRLGFTDLPWLATVLSAVFDAGSVVVLVGFGRRLGWGPLGAACVGLAWAINPMSIAFATGGMETSLFVLITLSVLGLAAQRRLLPLAACLAGTATLVRPEGALLLLVVLGCAWVALGGPSRLVGQASRLLAEASRRVDEPTLLRGEPSRRVSGPSRAANGPSRLLGRPSRLLAELSRLVDGASLLRGEPSRPANGPSRPANPASRPANGPSHLAGGPSRLVNGPSRLVSWPSLPAPLRPSPLVQRWLTWLVPPRRSRAAAAAGWVVAGSGAAPILAAGLVLWWRYGSPLPNSVAAKQVAYQPAWPLENAVALLVQAGLPGWSTYLLSVVPAIVGVIVAALGLLALVELVRRALPWLERESIPWQPFAAFGMLYVGFYVVVGLRGVRLFPWYLVPLVPLYLLAAAAGLARLAGNHGPGSPDIVRRDETSVQLGGNSAPLGQNSAPPGRNSSPVDGSSTPPGRNSSTVDGSSTTPGRIWSWFDGSSPTLLGGVSRRPRLGEDSQHAGGSSAQFGSNAGRLGVSWGSWLAAILVLWQVPAINWSQPLLPAGESLGREAVLLSVGRELGDSLSPTAVVAAPEIGALGYASNLRMLDTVGLVSPAALAYYPLSPDQLVTDNAIPPRLIVDLRPDVVVTLDAFASRSLVPDAAFQRDYRLDRAAPAQVWQSQTLLIFRRADEP